eukprot:2317295-Alexandrium_andersonii.AAC.1
MPPETMASPPFPIGVIAAVPSSAVRTRGSACAAFSCCHCGGLELHMLWPGCTRAGAPPSRVFPMA